MMQFAYRGFIHIDRTDPDHKVVEELHGEWLYGAPMYQDDAGWNMVDELDTLGDALDALHDGVHVVFVVGRVAFVTYPSTPNGPEEYDQHMYIDTVKAHEAKLGDLEWLRSEDPRH